MVKSNVIYSPQTFIEALTDKCYFFNGENITGEIRKILKKHNIKSRDYRFEKINKIVADNANVVLVDVSGFDESLSYHTEFRWFEVPKWFNQKAE